MKKVVIITGCIIVLLLGVVYGLWQDGKKPNFGIIPWILFGLALAVGITRRLIVARRAGNLREGFEPLRDASSTFENMVLGRPQETRPEVANYQTQDLPKDRMD